jgi:hypothetical protein
MGLGKEICNGMPGESFLQYFSKAGTLVGCLTHRRLQSFKVDFDFCCYFGCLHSKLPCLKQTEKRDSDLNNRELLCESWV